MQEILILLRYRCLDLLRYVRQHAFGFFALGPLFLGGALWIAERYLGQYRELLAEALETSDRPGLIGFGLVLLLIVLPVGAVRRELFPLGTAQHWLEILPVRERSRLISSGVLLSFQLLPAALILLFLTVVALPVEPTEWLDRASWGLRLLLVLPILALGQMAIVLLLNHFAPWQGRRGLVGILVILLSTVGVSRFGEAREFVLWPLQAPAFQMETIFAQALGILPRQGIPTAEVLSILSTLLAWSALVGFMGLRWRRRDLETYQRSQGKRNEVSGAGRGFETLLTDLTNRPIRAQVLRDLLLIRRRFSPAVDLALVGAFLSYSGVLFALPLLGLVEAWWIRFAQLGCLLATLSVAGVLPWLLAHELPRFWIERSTGLELSQIWQAKPWVARWLALPTLVIGALILWTSLPSVEGKLLTVILPFLLGGWMIATAFGVAVFEVPERPLLGWLFSSMIGLAFALLVIFVPMAWWLWAIGFIVVAGLFKDRAGRRIQLTEVPRS